MRPHRTILFATPTALLALALLAGCVPIAEPDPVVTGSASPTPTATATPTPSATPDKSVPVTISCDELVSPQVMYDYNSNFALQADFTPADGSLAAQSLAEMGVACSWVNLTSGQTIEMSASRPPATQLEQRKNDLVSSSNSVPTYDVEGYFLLEGGVGTAQAFDGPYWIASVSAAFFEPGDVTPLMAAAIGALN